MFTMVFYVFSNKDFISYDKLVYVFNSKRSAKVDFSCHNPLPLKNNSPMSTGMAVKIYRHGETGNMTGFHGNMHVQGCRPPP